MRWQDVEAEVTRIAESVWSVPASPEREAGVKCDIILKPKKDYWVLIEVSKEDNLGKLRDDMAKLGLVRQALMGRQIYSECFFVTSGEHSSLRESGESLNIQVHNLSSFAAKFLGARQYFNERRKVPFGSAVQPDTGKVDTAIYTTISYVDSNGAKYDIKSICDLLAAGRKVVLMGEFGTGKSRCLMEVFERLANAEEAFIPLAINLRDNWGYKRLSHIVQNHLDSLGLSEFRDNLVRSLRGGNHILLLDGFDEIGSQSWSGDPKRLMEIRKLSLEGVRDLIEGSGGGGVFITGREHYFNSDAEMAYCLGLNLDEVLIIKCPEEFSEDEAVSYIRSNGALSVVPEWMPRKPLICQLLARLDSAEAERLQNEAEGEVSFFERVFDAICTRETRIHSSIHKETLKDILLSLSQATRERAPNDEKVDIEQINRAFYDSTGYSPIDESAILLQRLPYLGRMGSGSADRIFIDPYAKDGLRGLALSRAFDLADKEVARKKWQQPIGIFGIRVLAAHVDATSESEKYARLCMNHGNVQVACDYVSLKLLVAEDSCDFGGMEVVGGYMDVISFANLHVSNLTISQIDVREVVIEASDFSSVRVLDCVISKVTGIGSAGKLPDVFVGCVFGAFDTAVTVARISELKLSNKQKTLLALLKKLFFQPGAGRKEEALLRGAESYWDADAATEALHYMKEKGLVLKVKGNRGWLYIPQRKYTKRMGQIFDLQSSCSDELWELVSK